MALHTTPLLPAGQQNIHALWLRLAHWINALAILIMVTSGWQIYNASPLFDFEFSKTITLGGWLGAPFNGTLPGCGYSA